MNETPNKMKPILFSTPMVQAILAGNKSQTRRIVKFPDSFDGKNVYNNHPFGLKYGAIEGTTHRLFPKWETGDVLWVRESHYRYGYWNMNGITKTGKQKWKFIADKRFNEIRYFDNPPAKVEKNTFRGTGWYKRNSLFMPHEACRLFLKITDVRVEKLQDISNYDCHLEGIEPWGDGKKFSLRDNPLSVFQLAYSHLWESINGKGSWELNPFVWVIKFERITKPE